MKVLVTGASGLLGNDVCKVFSKTHEITAIGRTQPASMPLAQWRECDLRDAAQTYKVITKENPDLIVHCASYNDVDGAEKNPDEAHRVNALGARHLALACQRFDTVLMAISTDYVFDGENAPETGYREFDQAKPISAYAHSKRWAEVFVEQLLNKYFIVRTSWLFGPGRATFIDKAVEWTQEGKTVTCVTDMCSIPTYTPDLAQALLQLAESGLYGMYHLTNSGEACTRADFAREVLRLRKLSDKGIKTMTQNDFKLAARRPVFSALDNLTWRLNGFTPLRAWKDALREHAQLAAATSHKS